jgi:ketosteroid isomerase-like protein
MHELLHEELIMSNTMEVGKKLVELCKQDKHMEAIETLYSPNIVSVEAGAPPGKSPRMEGIAAVKGKAEWWYQNHEIHSGSTEGPWPHGDRFIVRFSFEVTAKSGPMAGQRFKMDEAGLYTVKDGKIVQEEFFYHMG